MSTSAYIEGSEQSIGVVVVMLADGLSFTLLAVALGLDGFSLCLAIGMYNLRFRRILLIGITIGFFHMLLPFIGLLVGHFLSLKWTTIASTLGSFILVFIGLYMIFSSLQASDYSSVSPYGLRLLTIAFFVSIDSFPVGLSLGLSGVKTILFLLLFGLFTMILSWLGLLIGKKTSEWFGVYSEMVGGLILFSFGISHLFIFT